MVLAVSVAFPAWTVHRARMVPTGCKVRSGLLARRVPQVLTARTAHRVSLAPKARRARPGLTATLALLAR